MKKQKTSIWEEQIRKTSIWEEPNFGIWILDKNQFFEPNMASPG